VKTAKYLFSLYPESINISSTCGRGYPIHMLFDPLECYDPDDLPELARFLLKHDKGAISIPGNYGNLPLHNACGAGCFDSVQLMFDAYPEGIYVRNENYETPLSQERRWRRNKFLIFLERQVEFHHQSRVERVQDNQGQLPIHRALLNGDITVGAIKLMVSANPTSITVGDYYERIPLHIACQECNLGIVKCLVSFNVETLQTPDSSQSLALHYACLGGKCDVVNYILDKSIHGVTVQNIENKLPIELLLYEAECDRNSLTYIGTVDRLLRSSPAEVLTTLLGKKH